MKYEISFFRISNGALAAEKFPTRLKLLNWGENNSIKGIVRVGALTLSALSVNQKEAGFDWIALDYEHNTLPGTLAFKADKEPRKVAAYGVPRVIANDGLYLEDIEWTPAGREFAREYIDLSPAPHLAVNNEVDFLHSVALCRQGAVDDLSFYSIEVSAEGGSASGGNQTNKEKENMDYKKNLIALLALNADATDDQIGVALSARVRNDATALTALSAQVKDLTAKITAMSAVEGTAHPDPAAITTLTAKVGILEANVTNFTAELAKRDRAALCDQAGREGKVVPLTAEQITAMPIPTLKDMIAALPVTVPVTALTAAGLREKPLGNVITDNDKKIAANCGIKLEQK